MLQCGFALHAGDLSVLYREFCRYAYAEDLSMLTLYRGCCRYGPLATVRVAVLEEWNTVTRDEIRRVVDNMPQRVQGVLATEGGHTRW